MNGVATINTDAGFYHIESIGAYAYWIKSDGLFLKGSGIFKDKCTTPQEAEKKAIINALFILENSNIRPKKIVINRDCLGAKADLKGDAFSKMMFQVIDRIKAKSKTKGRIKEYCIFRHVKGHSHTRTKRNWVNDWCDKECTRQLKEYKAKLVQPPDPMRPVDQQ